MPRYKTPPHNDEAEQSVIGAVLIDNDCLHHLDLSSADFYHTSNQIIWKAFLNLHAAQTPIDMVTVSNHLRKEGTLDEAGGVSGIADTFHATPETSNVATYAKIVKDKAARRKLIEQVRELAVQAYDDVPMEEIIDDAQVTFRYILEELGSCGKRSVAEEVREWALLHEGYVSVTSCYHELHLVTKEQKTAARVALTRLCKDGKMQRHPSESGKYKKVNEDCDIIKWWESSGDFVPIKFPMGIHDYCHLYPKNIAVIAGAPNAGKSAFLLDFCRLNKDYHKIRYLSSEMVDNELKKRIEKFCIEHDMGYDDWKQIDFRERSKDFADVVDPDNITVIDYLECNTDFYMMGQWMKDIFDRLKTGICLIAIQKKPGDDNRLGRGGLGTLEKPRLYLGMDNGKIRIEKGKNWAIEGVNPNGLEKKFSLIQGCKFKDMSEWEDGKC